MARTMILMRRTQFDFMEMDTKFYVFTTDIDEIEIANKLANQHDCVGSSFVRILNKDGGPIKTIDC